MATSAALCVLMMASACVSPSPDDASNQQAVERNLLPAVIAEGSATGPWHIADRMRRYNVPGLSIAVIHNGQIDWVAGYGTRRADSDEAVTSSTVFQAASLSKPVAAATALSLVSDALLDLDADVNQRLQSWTLESADGEVLAAPTLRALLSHTAGVNVSGFAGYASDEPLPTLLQVLNGTPPANSLPIRVSREQMGRYQYSGGGYQVVQLLIEQATGADLATVARERVLEPFGMSSSTFAVARPPDGERDAAAGHRHDGTPVPGGWLLYPQQAAASLWSTPTDLANFMLGVLRAYNGRDTSVMSRDIAKQMLERQGEAIGLGVGLHGDAEQLHFDHAGWTRGFRSYFVAYPATGNGVVVMANGDDGNLLIEEVVRSVSGVYGWPDFKPTPRTMATLDSASLHKLAGTYHVPVADLTLTVTAHGNHLLVSTPRGSRYTFHPTSDANFFAIEDGAELDVVMQGENPSEIRLWGLVATRELPRDSTR